jgi:hypothetical protein
MLKIKRATSSLPRQLRPRCWGSRRWRRPAKRRRRMSARRRAPIRWATLGRTRG